MRPPLWPVLLSLVVLILVCLTLWVLWTAAGAALHQIGGALGAVGGY